MTPTKAPGAEQFLPEDRSLGSLSAAAGCCRGCPLYENASQTVFGHGHPDAPIMLVGEQPGDREDVEGLPFVGPAGRLLARALDDAGIDPELTYQTNAVKHFKFTRKDGKRRIHQKPSRTEVVACRPWLIAEIEALQPQLIVLLGATAAQSLLGTAFRVSAHRGELLQPPPEAQMRVQPQPALTATVHPSAVLRDRDNREQAYKSLVDDLRNARIR
jgi:DNA polymerase